MPIRFYRCKILKTLENYKNVALKLQISKRFVNLYNTIQLHNVGM